MKICILCFNFREGNLRKQPWCYVYQIAKGLTERGIDTCVITTGKDTTIERIRVRGVHSLDSIFLGESDDVIRVLDEEEPNLVVKLMGTTSFLKIRRRIFRPVVGILTSPIYTVREVMSVGVGEFIRHGNYLWIHLVGSLIPHALFRRSGSNYETIVVLSEKNRNRLVETGITTNLVTIPPGIDSFDLELPSQESVKKIRTTVNPEGLPLILYFTSPLTVRGTDVLVKAFARVKETIPAKLVFLSRMDYPELNKDINYLKTLAAQKGVIDSVEFITQTLSRNEVKEYLVAADVICLPFKLVLSDAPISILEAMALRRPVISTDIAGIPEMLGDDGHLIGQNDISALAERIHLILENSKEWGSLSEFKTEHSMNDRTWSRVNEEFQVVVESLVGSK
jgi:phosphatidylinositol alpha-1,6-mannosyltransferase